MHRDSIHKFSGGILGVKTFKDSLGGFTVIQACIFDFSYHCCFIGSVRYGIIVM